ncbi:MAG: bifunctional hydroxymethylpyrimidine kinase/phosphomethylpyrimidine kinase [Bacteroidales bacterium]
MQQSKKYISCLTIAGSDSGGGAGMQADIKTFSALGVYGASAITAITAQNTCGVEEVFPIPSQGVKAQIEAVFNDMTIEAVKIGMLHSVEVVQVVIEMLERYHPPIVILDPVMVSTSGHRLIEENSIHLIATQLFSRATVITPNVDEAILLSGIPIQNQNDLYTAGEILLQKGCKAVLMKGGHLQGESMNDILFQAHLAPQLFSSPKIDTRNTHGTGCTLSSAIAAFMALGHPLQEAVSLAKQYIQQALSEGANVYLGKGHGGVNHNFSPCKYVKVDRIQKTDF